MAAVETRSWVRIVLGTGLFAGVCSLAVPVMAGGDCFTEIERGRAPVVACEHPLRLTDDERADLRKLTRDMLKDATCVVSIRIERRQVQAALVQSEHIFEAPPQPVRCEVITPGASYPITATFAPRVVFKGDIAAEGSPGLTNVEGVPGYLAWPVVQYINRAPGIRSAMLDMVNAYRAHYRRRVKVVGR
ncbi:MAG: hypothetical protein SFW09_11510 [Hyphomicrobiaceae bacterium]|nr:hypothetical protein [Hyphomicrobiaceae bacterium]